MENFSEDTDTAAPDAKSVEEGNPSELALVQKIQKRIADDKAHHEDAFKQMRRDMFVARFGRTPEYSDKQYKANLAGRHVKQKAAALYAKNPKAVAKRKESLDFKVWDENPQSLQMAMQTLGALQQMMGSLPVDPMTGAPSINEQDPVVQQAMQAFNTAFATVQDFQQGMERRTLIQKIGRTLEVLFAYFIREQKPVDFKTAAKQLVRRACATGVGYVELGFQREMGPRPATTEKLADFRARLDHLRALTERVTDTEDPVTPDDPEIAELEKSIAALQAEPEVVLREGLIIDFPQATKVIPDKLCRQLVGFIGSRHLTIEYMYTVEQVQELFQVDLRKGYKGYSVNQKYPATEGGAKVDDELTTYKDNKKAEGLCCVWKHYDKESGLVYYVAEGYNKFLREPAAPDVFVEDFWPVYALTFNEVESEQYLFPPSDVFLMLDQQMDYNFARQGLREHRYAARPRWVFQKGALEDDDAEAFGRMAPFTAKGMNLPQGAKIGDILQAVTVPGVDPNLYETGQIFTDVQLTVGSSEAQFGGVAKATATESAIAANSTASSDGASVDDLDAFLTVIARSSGQILLREMSEEQVVQIVGVGAVWPELTLAEIASEVFLEVEAGSTGKPNQAVEIDNMQKLAPFLLQIPELDKRWLAKQFLMRLDDKLDLTEAFAAGAPSIMAQNAMVQSPAAAPSGGDPQDDPAAQGGKGGDNAPRDSGEQRGSEPAFGSNQV